MGLKGLDKGQLEARLKQTSDEAALKFISSASMSAAAPEQAKPAAKKKAAPKSKRVNFSLDDTVDRNIDKISLLPRHFKASRSDVVRAGVKLLLSMPRAEAIEALRGVVGAEEDTQEEHQQ